MHQYQIMLGTQRARIAYRAKNLSLTQFRKGSLLFHVHHALTEKIHQPHDHFLFLPSCYSTQGRSYSGISLKCHVRQTSFLRLTLAVVWDLPFATPHSTFPLHPLGKEAEMQQPQSGITASIRSRLLFHASAGFPVEHAITLPL